MPSKFLIFVSLAVLSAATFRVLLLSSNFLELLLHHESNLHQRTSKSFPSSSASLPWSSVASLEKDYGHSSDLGGRKVRDLYKNVLLGDKLHNWVEGEVAKFTNTAEQQQDEKKKTCDDHKQKAYIATSCAKMRWQARIYARRRHNMHPFSSEYLGLRDAWVHGVQKKSWRNVVSCIAQHEDYPCPSLTDKIIAEEIAAMEADGAGESSSPFNSCEKKDNWIPKTIVSCRKTNEHYDKILKKSGGGEEDL